MSMTAEQSNTLQLKGSSRVISDYFEICIHNILFQRKIYPREEFKVIRKFGLNVVFSQNENITEYIKKIIKQLHFWIYNGKINWLTLLIVSKETNAISEKWMFNIDVINDAKSSEDSNTLEQTSIKSLADIQKEIQSIIRQISSSVTYLPIFDEEQTFKILVHTTGDVKSNKDWSDTKGFKELDENISESVQFDQIETNNHNVSTFVTYKTID